MKRTSVIPVPHIVPVPIDVTYQFLILASNGLWGVLDYLKYLHQLLAFTHYLRMHECSSPKHDFVCQYLISLTGDNLTDSNTVNHLQDEIKPSYSNKGILQSDSKGNLKQNQWKCSRKNYRQNKNGIPNKETNDHKYQPNPELSLFSNNEVNSSNRDTLFQIQHARWLWRTQFEDRKFYLSFHPQWDFRARINWHFLCNRSKSQL